jgi:tetratricopeptide (TPR) repeat protein
MSDPLRTDGSRAHADVASGLDRDAKIEQLLLVGLDHYFASRYELAINVWTRALFLDRSHARARAYIERARSALAERQRESEELLQTGLAAFHRGDGDQARRLLQAAIEAGAPSEEALAVLERLNRIETAIPAAAAARSDRAHRGRAPRDAAGARRPIRGMLGVAAVGAAIVALGGFAVARDRVDWQSLVALARSAIRADSPAAVQTPVAREVALPLPRRGETTLTRARMLMASGRLRDALTALEAIRPTDPQKADADRLRGDIQRLLLSFTPIPAAAPDRDKADRRVP